MVWLIYIILEPRLSGASYKALGDKEYISDNISVRAYRFNQQSSSHTRGKQEPRSFGSSQSWNSVTDVGNLGQILV